MVRALIQPLEGTSASPGARPSRRTAVGPRGQHPVLGRSRADARSPQATAIRPGFGLLVTAAASLSLWAALIGVARFALRLLH